MRCKCGANAVQILNFRLVEMKINSKLKPGKKSLAKISLTLKNLMIIPSHVFGVNYELS